MSNACSPAVFVFCSPTGTNALHTFHNTTSMRKNKFHFLFCRVKFFSDTESFDRFNKKFCDIKKMFYSSSLSRYNYQTSHFFTGFIIDPSGQLKSFAKSRILLSGPSTRNCAGECTCRDV